MTGGFVRPPPPLPAAAAGAAALGSSSARSHSHVTLIALWIDDPLGSAIIAEPWPLRRSVFDSGMEALAPPSRYSQIWSDDAQPAG